MKKRFKKYTTHFIFMVVALQILNMSVSGRIIDYNYPLGTVDDSVNIADHAIEFVVENMLGFTNAFPEKKELKERHCPTCCQKIQAITLFSFQPSIQISHTIPGCSHYLQWTVNPFNHYLLEIAHPPPKLA